SDAEFYTALRNTFFFAFFVVLGESILPLLMALAMNERLPFRAVFRTAFFLPVVCSWVVVSLIWAMLFAQQGLMNSVVQVLGVSPGHLFRPDNLAHHLDAAVHSAIHHDQRRSAQRHDLRGPTAVPPLVRAARVRLRLGDRDVPAGAAGGPGVDQQAGSRPGRA